MKRRPGLKTNSTDSVSLRVTCPKCEGVGRLRGAWGVNLCHACDGAGLITVTCTKQALTDACVAAGYTVTETKENPN